MERRAHHLAGAALNLVNLALGRLDAMSYGTPCDTRDICDK